MWDASFASAGKGHHVSAEGLGGQHAQSGREGAGHPGCPVPHRGSSVFHLDCSPLPDSQAHSYSTAGQTNVSKLKVCDF